MDSSKIKAIIVAIIATFAAVYLGITAATAQFETIAWVVGVLALICCLMLGNRIWILIPFMGAMDLTLRIPGQPTTLLIAQMAVLCFSVLLLMMRKLPFQMVITELEWWLIVFSLLVLQAYLRNPVGLNIFGGGMVGGRPYVMFAVAIAVALILATIRIQIKDLKAIVRWSIMGGLVNIGLTGLGAIFPSIGYWTGSSFENTGETNYENREKIDVTQAGRINSLPTVTRNVSLWVASFVSPLKGLFHPFWSPLVLLTIVGSAYSGYRTAVLTVGLTYVVGIAYRGGFIALVISGVGGALAVAVLAIVNMIYPLPPNLQRAFSFLPGTWNQQYVNDATGSTDWRVEIWEDALLGDRWIKNKILGDGMGFSAAELAAQMSYRIGTRTGVSGLDAHKESIMANGDYHSTLVSTVRTCGYIGAVILIIGTFRLAVHAHRLIKRHRNDEYYVLCLFQGIPLVAAPIWLFISASNFGTVASSFILGIGMIRLLENNIPREIEVEGKNILPAITAKTKRHIPASKSA